MPYVNIPRSKLIGAVSKQVGKMYGDLSRQINDTSMVMEKSYRLDGCPTTRGTQRNRNKLTKLNQSSSRINRRLNKFRKMPRRLKRPLRGLKKALKIILSLPIPQSVPPGFGIPVNVTTKFADIMHLIKEFIAQIGEDIEAIEIILEVPNRLTGILQLQVTSLELATTSCELENALKDELAAGNLSEQELKELDIIDDEGILITSRLLPRFIGSATDNLPGGVGVGTSAGGSAGGSSNLNDTDGTSGIPGGIESSSGRLSPEEIEAATLALQALLKKLENSNVDDKVKDTINNILNSFDNLYKNNPDLQTDATGELKNAPAGSVLYTAPNGEVYALTIKKDKDSPSIAPRRFAVAINEEGVEVLTGPKSFASDTDVLIEEIKFRLDNQLP